jgi:hypothetical protein
MTKGEKKIPKDIAKGGECKDIGGRIPKGVKHDKERKGIN